MNGFRVTALLLMIGFTAGCGQRPSATLTVTMSLAEDEWQVMRREIFPPFEKKHNVSIKSYQVASGQLAVKLKALQAAATSRIDVFAQDNMDLANLVAGNLVTDLSPYEKDIPAAVLPNLVKACRFDGKLMFLPFRPNVQIVYTNEPAFKKYGLGPPRTWEELLAAARTFREKEGTGRVLLKGYGGNPTATQVYEFVLQAGGQPYSFDDEGCVRAFTFLRQLAPYLSPKSKRAKWDTTNDVLARQEAYLAQNWPFGISVLIKDYGLPFIRTFSGWKGPAGEVHVIGGDVFGIPANSQNKDLALKFITYMQSRKVQETLTARLGWPSIRDDAYAEVEDWQRPYFASVAEALRHGVFRKQVRWWPSYAKYVTAAFNAIVFEGAPVEATLKNYKKELERAKQLYE